MITSVMIVNMNLRNEKPTILLFGIYNFGTMGVD